MKNPLDKSPASTLEPSSAQVPIYATVNKEKKKKKSQLNLYTHGMPHHNTTTVPPEIPPPYQDPATKSDLAQPSNQVCPSAYDY